MAAIIHTGKEYGVPLSILMDVVRVNKTQSFYYLEKLEKQMAGFAGKNMTVLGISFKPNTDDTREAPALTIIRHLLEKGAGVRVHDPAAKLPENWSHNRLKQHETF